MRRMLIVVAMSALVLVGSAMTQQKDRGEVELQAAIRKETVEGKLKEAIEMYKKLAQSANRAVAARALLRMGQCYEKLGDAEARKAYERVVREFADQKEAVEEARKHLAKNGGQAETGVVARQIGAKLGDRFYGEAISRDGRHIAYTNHGVLWVHDLVTGEQHRLIGEAASPEEAFGYALISPDGKHVAYARYALRTAPPELYVIGADGSNPRLLAGGKDYSAYPVGWSPDGKHILARFYWKEKEESRTALVSVADGSSRVIGSQLRPRFSPDGRYIAFVKYHPPDSKDSDIFLQPVDGGAEIPLVRNVGRVTSGAWSPDGKRVLFTSNRNGSDDLWSIPVADGKPAGPLELVKEGISSLLDITRDGDCYYQTQTMMRDLYVAEVNPQTGKLISRPKQITSRDVNAGAAWSPNGELLAYYAGRGPQGAKKLTVVIRSMKTGEERELSPKDPLIPSFQKPQWFPDSRSLFLHSRDGKLRQLDVQTSEYRPVLDSVTIPPYRDGAANPTYNVPIVLAPDGRAIYYLVRDQEAHQTRILRRDLEGGPEIELCRRNADVVRGLSVSPDGLRLAFQEKASSAIAARGNGEKKPSWTIVTLATSGGQPKEAYRNPHWIEGPVWSKDGARLFFVGGWPRDIFCIPAEGGEPQPLDIGLHDLYFLNIHPDGKQIVFADEQYNNQLWVIKNLLAGPKAAR